MDYNACVCVCVCEIFDGGDPLLCRRNPIYLGGLLDGNRLTVVVKFSGSRH